MVAVGYSITGIADIPAGGVVENVIKDKPGQQLKRASQVFIYLTREGVDVQVTVVVGGTTVFPAGPANINTVVGTLPSTQDDRVIEIIAGAGDDIIISGTNANASAQELRALVQVIPIA